MAGPRASKFVRYLAARHALNKQVLGLRGKETKLDDGDVGWFPAGYLAGENEARRGVCAVGHLPYAPDLGI